MNDLISRKKVIEILEKEKILRCGYDADIAIFSIEKGIKEMPTAYSVDKVVAELGQKKEEVQRMRNTCVALSDLEVCDIENVTYERAIEIVKQGGIYDDMCEWKSVKLNYEWKPSCEPNSTYNVCGVAWFKRCPYCGKKIKIVGD